jgi:hypothetical protein
MIRDPSCPRQGEGLPYRTDHPQGVAVTGCALELEQSSPSGNEDFFQPSCRTGTETVINQTSFLQDGFIMPPPAPILPLFKPKAHVSTLETELGLLSSIDDDVMTGSGNGSCLVTMRRYSHQHIRDIREL